MATVDRLHITIGVRRKPLLYVAAIAYHLDGGRGGLFHKLGNKLIDHCVTVT